MVIDIEPDILGTSKNNIPRICILMELYFPVVGGAETHARLLSAKLIKRNVNVFVLTRRRLKAYSKREFVDGVEIVRVMPYGFKRLGKYLMIMPAIIRLIVMRNQYEIIYVCGLRILGVVGVVAAKYLGKKSIVRSESCGEMSGEFTSTNLKRDAHRAPTKLINALVAVRNKIMLGADCFLAISDVIRVEYTSSGVDESKIINIPNGIDTEKYCPASEDKKAEIRRILQMADRLTFVYTGKLNKGKGLELLLVVWKKLIEKHDNVHLYLVGSGDYQALGCENELQTFVTENQLRSSVTFTGYVDNVQDYLKASDCFLLPSDSEAHPLSLIEALSCGLFSISTATGGMLDVIKDGVNGKLVPVGDEIKLFNAICEFMDTPVQSKKLGLNGRKTVLENYGIESIVDRHIDLFYQSSSIEK